MFSFLCKRCKNPLLSPLTTTRDCNDNTWMSDAVAISPAHHLHRGRYDGYGRVGDQTLTGQESVWHAACWELEGRPTSYRGASSAAPDQGVFFPSGTYDLPDPALQAEETAPPTAQVATEVTARPDGGIQVVVCDEPAAGPL